MKTAKANREEVRTETITITVNKEEKQEIQSLAGEMGVSMSTFVRFALKNFMKKG